MTCAARRTPSARTSRKISYAVKIKILGSMTTGDAFIPGVRRIPHITSQVIKADSMAIKTILKQVLQEKDGDQRIGTYFLDDSVKINFKLQELTSKRTFIFARAGYGKSNLMKILTSQWKPDFGSLVIFDPGGEYAFTNQADVPGIMDGREAIFFTKRHNLPEEVGNVYKSLKLNLKEIDHQLFIPVVVPSGKHENIFFQKLMGMNRQEWCNLIDVIYNNGWRVSNEQIQTAMDLPQLEESNMAPIRNNLVLPISELHEPTSLLLSILEQAMRQGRIIIIDIALLDARTALQLSSIIVKHVFHKNQSNFIAVGGESLIKATFVVEEAQSVLSNDPDTAAFIELAKEGRKYGLGGIFVTQQPASIPFEILSQADNFFVFHLLSKGDLGTLSKANAHYSNDVLTQLLNEPVKGKCYMWTSSQPFVLPVKVDKFEDIHKPHTAKAIQEQHPILHEIMEEIDAERKNPLYASILTKVREVEDAKYEELGEKTKGLFRHLTSEEKEYLKKSEKLQQNKSGEFFAVKSRAYLDLLIQVNTVHP